MFQKLNPGSRNQASSASGAVHRRAVRPRTRRCKPRAAPHGAGCGHARLPGASHDRAYRCAKLRAGGHDGRRHRKRLRPRCRRLAPPQSGHLVCGSGHDGQQVTPRRRIYPSGPESRSRTESPTRPKAESCTGSKPELIRAVAIRSILSNSSWRRPMWQACLTK